MTSSTAIISTLARRLRDPLNFAHPSAVLTRLIDQCQRILNISENLVLNTVSFPMQDTRVLYRYSEIAPDIAKVLMVRDGKRNLFDQPWRSIVHNDPKWYRRIGKRIELFSRIGNDMLLLYPCTMPTSTVEILYSTTKPTGPGTDIGIPDEFVQILTDMVEMLALLRGRRLGETKDLLQRIPEALTHIGSESIEDDGHA